MPMIRRSRPHAYVVSTRKTTGAIPAGAPFTRDLVVQSVLDSGVRRVEFLDQIVYDGAAVAMHSIVVTRDDGRFLLDLVGTRPNRSTTEQQIVDLALEVQGIERVETTRDTIRREPRFSNARLIWQHRGTAVMAKDRQRITTYLSEHGPQIIGRLETEVDVSIDVMTAVCALACDDLLEIDLDSAPLGRGTRVAIQR